MTRLARLTGREAQSVRDDRILPVTRWVARIIAPILLAAFFILFGVPDRTTELFAWTINPNMTPIVMGAGYGTGVYFFYRVATVDDWHRVAPIFPGIAVFTWFMALATILHWENFNHDHVTFYLWVILYVVSPILIPAIWVTNRRTDPGLSGDTPVLPRLVRWASGITGLLITVTATVLFFTPQVLIDFWVWTVSPLTARILLGWFAIFGVVNLAVAFDTRWSAARILIHTQVLGSVLLLLGSARAWGDFDQSNPFTWVFLGGLVAYLLAISVLYYVMETR